MVFKRCSIGTKGPKVCQESTPHTLHPHNQPEPLRQWFSCSLLQILTLPSECRSRNPDSSCFSNLLLSSFGDPVWSVSSVCCSYLTGAAPGVVFCCWSPSASGFDVLCVQRWCSAYLGWNSYCCLSVISNQSILLWPLTSTRHFHPHNCRSLDIFSFSDHSL